MNLFPQLPPDVQAFLFWVVSTPGGLLSQLEKVAWFAALSTGRKLAIQVVLSAVAAAAFTILASTVLPAGTLDKVNAAYLIIVQVITAVVANFGTHIAVNVIAKPAGAALKAYAQKNGPAG